MTWKWQGHLTPYGEGLRDSAFENINFRHYSININEQERMWDCRVTRNGQLYKVGLSNCSDCQVSYNSTTQTFTLSRAVIAQETIQLQIIQ
jgi:hypothetical protein